MAQVKVQQCQQQLEPDAKPQAGVLLAAIDFEFEQLLAPIAEAFPGLELIGGTTDGEISSVLGFEQDSVSLMLFCSDRITIRTGIGEHLSDSVEGAVQRAVAMASQGHQGDPVLGVAIYESLTDNVAKVLGCINANLSHDIPILGGLTADQWRFKQTYQFYNGKVYDDAVVLLFFSGPLAFSFGVKSGWCPIGQPGVVTKQDSNVVYEIDHRPALDYYQHYLGDSPPSSESPLAVFQDGATDFYLRAPTGTVDAVIGSVTFFGEIPQGATVQITEANRSDVVNAAEGSMQQALTQFPAADPSAVMYFSCSSRRRLLGSRTGEEFEVAQACCDRPIPSLGFYTNGEISPLQRGQTSRFHNETFVTLLLGELPEDEPVERSG